MAVFQSNPKSTYPKGIERLGTEQSSFFSTFTVGDVATVRAGGSGDLWPSCWADDDNVYAANGDGYNFGGSSYYDVAVGCIAGTPGSGLTGTFRSGSMGPVWNGTDYNRKPTGMACVDGNLYLAMQDLRRDVVTNPFDNAPAATILKSTDKGLTWTWDSSAPMFGSMSTSDPNRYKFTTIMFLDYGKNYANSLDSYVYAYGIDNNWTQAYHHTVPDPTKIYLARVPKTSIQNRSTWEFYSGGSTPTWSSDINAKVAVLEDTRRLYQNVLSSSYLSNFSVISQGCVVYNQPLNRYILTSFSGSGTKGAVTHEFYEAPAPWGPWSLVTSKDYGLPQSWSNHYGGYAPTIPSKFISSDGKTMWLQSNDFYNNQNDYDYSLRQVNVEPYISQSATNGVDDSANLAVTGSGIMSISKSAHNAHLSYMNNGNKTDSEDDWDGECKPWSWWGYTWKQPYNMNKVVYTTGTMYSDGGWFGSGLCVQVRQNFSWVSVSNLTISPSYSYSSAAGSNQTYIFTFDTTAGDGVRIVGASGGTAMFTSISELEVYYSSKGEVII